MKYAAHYTRLIERARGRVASGYVERHHILPRCMGGTDAPANLVDLTPEEHYVAHQLLVKMHPANRKLAHAAVYMALRCSGNKAYGWLRRRKAEAWRGRTHSAETRARMSKSQRAAKRPASSLANLQAHLGNTYGRANRGRVVTQQHREQIAASLRGRKLSSQHRASISAGMRRKVEEASV